MPAFALASIVLSRFLPYLNFPKLKHIASNIDTAAARISKGSSPAERTKHKYELTILIFTGVVLMVM